MKIRSDFITNSSSSSFIIAINNENKITTERWIKWLNFYDEIIQIIKNSGYTVEQVAEEIVKDLKKSKPLTEKDMLKILQSGSMDWDGEWRRAWQKWSDNLDSRMKEGKSDNYYRILTPVCKSILKEFLDGHSENYMMGDLREDNKFYHLEYGNEDGNLSSLLEEIFRTNFIDSSKLVVSHH